MLELINMILSVSFIVEAAIKIAAMGFTEYW